MIDLLKITEGDIVKGNAPQLMICLVVDVSYSMIKDDRIGEVNKGIRKFITKAKSDPLIKDSLDLAIISFGQEKPTIVQEFKNVNYVEYKDMKADGGTPMCEAIELALDLIKKRKIQLENQGVSLYKPWLIIMSDGEAKENLLEDKIRLSKIVQDLYKKHTIKGKCIYVGDKGEENDLKRFSPNNQIEKMNAMDIEKFFNSLSMSVAKASIASPSEEDNSYMAF